MAVNLREIALMFGIDHDAANVYVELQALHQLTKNELKSFLAMESDKLDVSLASLQSRGLIRFDTSSQYYVPVDLSEFSSDAADTVENIKRVIFQLQESESLGIVKYEGWDGIRRVYLEVLEEAIKTGEDIYAFEVNIDKSEIGTDFLDSYINKRVNNKVSAFVLTPGNKEDFEYKKKHEGNFTMIKMIKDFEIDASINIVGDLVMTFSVDNPRGTLCRDAAGANTWRSVFRQLWKD